MIEKKFDVLLNVDALKAQYDAHIDKCKKIAKEVDKWGKKTKPTLNFLKNPH